MKIAQVSPYDINRPGGVQRHICDLSAELIKLGHEVTVISPRIDSDTKVALVSPTLGMSAIDYVGKGWLISLNGTQFEITLALGHERAYLDRLMQDGRFDIVHFHTLISPLMPMQVFLRSRCARVATFHNVPPDGTSGLIQRFLQAVVGRTLMKHLDEVILASDVQKELYSIGEESPSHVLPPCVNLRRFDAPVDPFAQYRSDRLNILFLGRLEPRKGAMVLVQAYRDLRHRGIAACLLVAGDGPERSSLEQFVQTHRVPDVIFLNTIPDADLPRLYATCDIFCAPSLYGEGFGIVIAEAMASGRPVVAAANEGYRKLLQGEAAAFLVRPGDVDATRRKLEALISDPLLCERLGHWGRHEAKRYDSELLAPKFVAIYERVIRSRISRSKK